MMREPVPSLGYCCSIALLKQAKVATAVLAWQRNPLAEINLIRAVRNL